MIKETEIMNRGFDCLLRELGDVETEIFVSFLLSNRFDYTKWREDKFDDMTLSEIGKSAADYAQKHPFKGTATVI